MKRIFASCFKSYNNIYVLLFILVLANCIAQCLMFGSNFFSLYDEAYCLLKCRDAYDGIITGKSQWDLIAVNWFPYLDLTNKVSASWASVILIIATIGNTILSLSLITRKCSFFKWSSIFLLLLFPVIGGEYASDVQTRVGWVTGVNYLILQVFMLESALSFFLLYYYHKHPMIRSISLVISGILSGLSLFVIIPSGILMIGALSIMIILKETTIRCKLYDILWFLIGICFALVYIHLFIAPLPFIYKEMLFTASYVEKSGFGYTPMDFMKSIAEIIGEFFLYLPILIGISQLSLYSSFKVKYIETTTYVVYIWVFVIFIYKFISMNWGASFMPTIPFLACSTCLILWHIFQKNGLMCRHNILLLFLFILPLICAVGTNTNLWGRLGCFIVPWGIIWIIAEDYLNIHINKKVIICFISLLIIPLSVNSMRIIYHYKKYNTEHFVSGNKNLAALSITPAQKEYFERIQNIVNQYNYQPRQSVFFASYHDYCTIYALDAELSSKFHLPCNFPFFPKEQMLRPDFIILVPEESHIYNLADFEWGWPDQYDKYEIGTPETIHQKLINDVAKHRQLYCRKSLKKAE